MKNLIATHSPTIVIEITQTGETWPTETFITKGMLPDVAKSVVGKTLGVEDSYHHVEIVKAYKDDEGQLVVEGNVYTL